MEIVVNARIKARLKQLQRKSGTSMSEIARQGIVRHIFVESPLSPHEEAELEQIIAEETAEREKRQQKKQEKG